MISFKEIDSIISFTFNGEIIVLGESTEKEEVELVDLELLLSKIPNVWSDNLIIIDKKIYLSKFNTITNSNNIQNDIIPKKSIIEYINNDKTKIIVALGDVEKNEEMIKVILPQVEFETLDLRYSGKCCKITIEDRRKYIYLLPSPLHSNNFGEGDYMMIFFIDFYERYLRPSLKSSDKNNKLDCIDLLKIEKYATRYNKAEGELRKELINNILQINEHMGNLVIELERLDEEYKSNIDKTMLTGTDFYLRYGYIRPGYELINNKKWEGYWKNCNGLDLPWFFSCLKEQIKRDNDNYNNDIIKKFLEIHERYKKVTYGAAMANYIYKRYFI